MQHIEMTNCGLTWVSLKPAAADAAADDDDSTHSHMETLFSSQCQLVLMFPLWHQCKQLSARSYHA